MLKLPLPPSINSYYTQNKYTGQRVKTGIAQDWESEAGYLLLRHKRYGDNLISVRINWYFKNNRSDVGNRTKILLDLLEKQGIITNDNQVYKLCEIKALDPDHPRCEITIELFKNLKQTERDKSVAR